MAKDRSFREHRVVVALSVVAAVVALIAHDRLIPLDTPLFGLFQNAVDAGVYRAGGQTVLHGTPLYDGNLIDDLPFTYPPFAALIFAPLGLISMVTTKLLFWVGNLALLHVAVRLCWRHLGYANDAWLTVVSACLAVVFTWLEPVRMTIWFGQINLLLMVAVLWDLTRPEGSRLRGVATGLAAGTKLTPGLFVVYLAATRQWRAAATAALATLTTVVAGFLIIPRDAARYWFTAVSESTRIGAPSSGANQSIRGALPRWMETVNPPVLLWAACVLVVGATGIAVAVIAHRRGHVLLGLTITGLTAPMVSPFSWGHHWVWFVPLIVLTMDLAVRRSRALWALPLALCAPLGCWYFTYPDGVRAIGTFMLPPPSFAVGVVIQSAYPLTYLAVVVGAAIALRRSESAEPPASTPSRYVTSVTSRDGNGTTPTPVTAPVEPPSREKSRPAQERRNSHRDTHSYRIVTSAPEPT
ncbi:glycosyltransferase 87 family protein [Actinomycetes bacterium M1A6_2h]